MPFAPARATPRRESIIEARFRTRLCSHPSTKQVLTRQDEETSTCISYDMSECNILAFNNQRVYHASPLPTEDSNPYSLLHVAFIQSTRDVMERRMRARPQAPPVQAQDEEDIDAFRDL
jgi:hypothetical protein